MSQEGTNPGWKLQSFLALDLGSDIPLPLLCAADQTVYPGAGWGTGSAQGCECWEGQTCWGPAARSVRCPRPCALLWLVSCKSYRLSGMQSYNSQGRPGLQIIIWKSFMVIYQAAGDVGRPREITEIEKGGRPWTQS